MLHEGDKVGFTLTLGSVIVKLFYSHLSIVDSVVVALHNGSFDRDGEMASCSMEGPLERASS